MVASVLESPKVVGVVEVEDEGIRERRERLGLTLRALADRAGVDRGRLSDIEKGATPRPSTLAQIRRALDEFEDETSGPYDHDAEERTVTFRMSGNFGVDVTVSGPVENLAELEDSVGRLLQRMRSDEQQ